MLSSTTDNGSVSGPVLSLFRNEPSEAILSELFLECLGDKAWDQVVGKPFDSTELRELIAGLEEEV
jgi:hypothetical protein